MSREQWSGVVAMVTDAVDTGAAAIADVHLATTGRVFTLLEAIPPLAAPVRLVHTIHDAGVSTTYEAVRRIDRLLGRALTAVLTSPRFHPPPRQPPT